MAESGGWGRAKLYPENSRYTLWVVGGVRPLATLPLARRCLAYNLLHMIRDTAFWGESVKPSIDSIIRRLVKVGASVVYHASRWYIHIASAFPLTRYYRILFA